MLPTLTIPEKDLWGKVIKILLKRKLPRMLIAGPGEGAAGPHRVRSRVHAGIAASTQATVCGNELAVYKRLAG